MINVNFSKKKKSLSWDVLIWSDLIKNNLVQLVKKKHIKKSSKSKNLIFIGFDMMNSFF